MCFNDIFDSMLLGNGEFYFRTLILQTSFYTTIFVSVKALNILWFKSFKSYILTVVKYY